MSSADGLVTSSRHWWNEAFGPTSRRPELWDGLAGAVASTAPLIWGAVTDHRSAGLTAGLGALNVALATPPAARSAQVRWGGAAVVGGTLAAGLGAAVGDNTAARLLLTFVIVGALSAVRLLGGRGALLGFVVSAVFVIVSGLPDLAAPGAVMAAFLAGGALALGLMLAVSRRGRDTPEVEALRPRPTTAQLVAHAIRLATAVTVAAAFAVIRDVSFGYWVPLTVLAVLQPEHHASLVRVLQRSLGTVVGVVLVAMVTVWTGDVAYLIPLVGLCALVLFALRERNYYWVVVALTPTALLMISTAAYEGWDIAAQRLVDTGIGLAIALAATGASLLIEHQLRSPPARG